MTYTVTELITKAYYASGIVGREFETVDGSQIEDGLSFLNDILGEKRAENGMIPYNTSTQFNTVVGQEVYNIPNLIQVDTMTFVKDSVRYPMVQVQRDQYQGAGRANNITSLPFTFNVERLLGGANVSMYFLPDEIYTITIHGLFDLASVALNQDLELTLDRFYITYLRYALADRLCTEFDYDAPASVMIKLDKMESTIKKRSQQLDLRMKKISTLTNQASLSYAQVNLGGGWYPTTN